MPDRMTELPLTCLQDKFPPVPARGTLDLNLVRQSKYFFA